MLNLVLFGPPGAGKGTQSSLLMQKYKLDNESRSNADSSEGSAEINQLHIQLLDMLKQVNIFIGQWPKGEKDVILL